VAQDVALAHAALLGGQDVAARHVAHVDQVEAGVHRSDHLAVEEVDDHLPGRGGLDVPRTDRRRRVDDHDRSAARGPLVTLADMVGAYKASKFLAERVADEWAARGAPVVIVNPSTPIGPWDVKPTPTGQMIVDFLDGKMIGSWTPASTWSTCATWRAATSWPPRRAAWASATSWATATSLAGDLPHALGADRVPAPRFRVPYAVAWMAAATMEAASLVTRRAPRVPLTAVRMARKTMFFSADKAIRELGLPRPPPRPLSPTR